MNHDLLVNLAKWEAILFVGAFAGVIAFRMIVGEINMTGLLWGKRADGAMYLSPERVQSLLATIAIAMQYLLVAAHSSNGSMPELPAAAVEVLGVSNAIYLGGKGWMMLHGRK